MKGSLKKLANNGWATVSQWSRWLKYRRGESSERPIHVDIVCLCFGVVWYCVCSRCGSQEKKDSNRLLQHTTYPSPPTTTNTPLLTHYSHLPPAGGTRHDPATRGVQPITNHSATDTSSPHCGSRFGHAHRYICPTGCANVAGKHRTSRSIESLSQQGSYARNCMGGCEISM